jgi:NADPH-dependent 2,4-dienoyl-CoA reductase/sulfur reductase-like enzyme
MCNGLSKTAMPSAQQPKNIVIVGGVAGGCHVPRACDVWTRKANITGLEKGKYVSYANCGLPYALGIVIKDESKLHVQTVEKIASWFNINVKTDAELVAIDRTRKLIRVKHCADEACGLTGDTENISYDKVVLALGAESSRPLIMGINSEHVFTLQTIPDLQHIQCHIATKKCQNVAVVGGGFIGLEAAENLRLLGLNVTVLEYLPHVSPPVDRDMTEPLHKEMERNGIHLVLNARIGEATSSQILLKGDDPIKADLVIVAAGVRPRTAVVEDAGIQVAKPVSL